MKILIHTSKAEKTVNLVLLYFLSDRKSFFRTDELDEGLILKLISKKSKSLCFWCRKGVGLSQTLKNKMADNLLDSYLYSEKIILFNFFIKKLEQKKHLGNYFLQEPNKLNHLSIAQESGLDVPKMLITNKKKVLLGFKNKYKSIINKSLKDSFTGSFDGIYYYNHTERVSDEVIESLDETFFLSLFQEELEKAYELRIVFVNDVLWTMAIFSQNDEKTSVDWRNYNHERPNRKTPYQLPQQVADNTRKFIKASGLNIGAIDMVVTKDRKFVFLECNPNGQISMTSESCNYFIEKHIAEYLSTP